MIVMGAVLLLARRSTLKSVEGLREWGFGFWIFALGNLSLAISSASVFFQGMVLGHTLIILGFLLSNIGTRLFFDVQKRHSRTRIFIFLSAFVASFAFFTLVHDSLDARIVIFSVFTLALLLDMIAVLWMHRSQSVLVYVFIGSLATLAISRILRIGEAIFQGSTLNPALVVEASLSHLLFLSLPAIVSPLITLALLIMVSEKAYRRLLQINRLDPLTQTLNKAALNEELEREINRSQRYDHPLSVLMIDIDNFKIVNDTQGHLAGDEILKNVASVVRASLRTTDTLARFGGDEFTVILTETSQKAALPIAQRTADLINQVLPKGCSVSVGMASFQEGDTLMSLVSRADKALYQAKSSNGNSVRSH